MRHASRVAATVWYRNGSTWKQCVVYYRLNGAWVQIRDFAESKTCTFTPSQAGTYHLYMDAIDGKKNIQCLMITVTVK